MDGEEKAVVAAGCVLGGIWLASAAASVALVVAIIWAIVKVVGALT